MNEEDGERERRKGEGRVWSKRLKTELLEITSVMSHNCFMQTKAIWVNVIRSNKLKIGSERKDLMRAVCCSAWQHCVQFHASKSNVTRFLHVCIEIVILCRVEINFEALNFSIFPLIDFLQRFWNFQADFQRSNLK